MPEETPQLSVSPQETQIQTPSFWERIQAQKKKILIGLGSVLGILILAGAVFGVYKYTQRQIPIEPTEGPIPTLEATPTPDSTTDWETYTNEEYSYSIKYPPMMNNQVAESLVVVLPGSYQSVISRLESEWWGGTSQSPNKAEDIIVAGIDAKKISGTQVATGYGLFEAYFPKKKLTFKIALYIGPEEKELRFSEGTFDLILSTFKFFEEEGTSPTPTPITQNYPRPSSWKTITISSLKISLCLPPKWEWETDASGYGHIVFNRDPAYKPNVAWINFFDYKGGSRREEYINLKVQYEYEPDKLRNETKVDEFSINGQSVLKIAIPSFPEAIVFVLDNKLYEVSLASWNLVNDSQSAFLKDIYTMVGCIQPI